MTLSFHCQSKSLKVINHHTGSFCASRGHAPFSIDRRDGRDKGRQLFNEHLVLLCIQLCCPFLFILCSMDHFSVINWSDQTAWSWLIIISVLIINVLILILNCQQVVLPANCRKNVVERKTVLTAEWRDEWGQSKCRHVWKQKGAAGLDAAEGWRSTGSFRRSLCRSTMSY